VTGYKDVDADEDESYASEREEWYAALTQQQLDCMARRAEVRMRKVKDAPPELLGEVAFQLERRIINYVSIYFFFFFAPGFR
jgi:hypothetical protein